MKKILGLGGVTTDQIGLVDHIPGSDEVIRLQEYRLQQGGMVATALVAATRLGAETEFLGAVGDDQNGRFTLERFAAEGVGTAVVNFATETAYVEYDDKITDEKKLTEVIKGTGYDVAEGTQKVVLSVGGMTCASCSQTIENALRKKKGIQ